MCKIQNTQAYPVILILDFIAFIYLWKCQINIYKLSLLHLFVFSINYQANTVFRIAKVCFFKLNGSFTF